MDQARWAPDNFRTRTTTSIHRQLKPPHINISNGHRLCEVGSRAVSMKRLSTTKAMIAAGSSAATRQPPRQRHRPHAGPANPIKPSVNIASMKPLKSATSPALGGVLTAFS